MHLKILSKTIAAIAIAAIVLQGTAYSENASGKNKEQSPGDGDDRAIFLSEIPEYSGNVILGRPTDCSVTASVMMNSKSKIFIGYGSGGAFDRRTETVELTAGEPRHILLDGLKADMAYSYRIMDAGAGKQILPASGNYSFHTARPPGSSFVFAVQADSHLDGNCLPELYNATLANELASHPDFLIDLGDTFMTGKIPGRSDAFKQYLAQRYYLGLPGNSSPVFLALGNHDGEETFRRGACEKDGLAVWSCETRKKYFPNPVPDSFYSGNTEKQTYAGNLQNYYSWTWGDAFFVVLDPYWYSLSNKGDSSPWGMTLGKQQYDWLAKTLRNSQSRFKFVFIHQLVGGLDKAGRGGSEAAPLFEWGGHEKDGTDTFAKNRPGWEKPIHDLFVET
ncbi:MAG: metallophosphoesterase, partial [Lentisphaerae bacterium]|nr:metallophosphoesterase [Lentisphaerota bacterium]